MHTDKPTLRLWLGELFATFCLFGLLYVAAMFLYAVQS